MFGSSNPASALASICALPTADCSKGIGISGISQGSQIAVMAGDYDPRFKAAYAISTGDVLVALGITVDMKSCMDAAPLGQRTFPNGRIRAVDGELDEFFGVGSDGGVSPDTVRTQLQDVTGMTSCGAGAWSCFRPDGSGWYEVQQSEIVGNDKADHFYVRDPGYLESLPWSVIPNLQWLAKTVNGP
jgi:hypothetical protein